QSAGLTLQLLERPRFTYTLAMEKSDSQGIWGSWHPTHNFNISDNFDISESFRIAANANYAIDEQLPANDIAFTYGIIISHDISRTMRENLSISRQPVDTFGTSADTDSTTIDYSFSKNDLFIYNLNLNLGVGYAIDRPMGPDAGPEERTWRYRAGLTHSRVLTRKITRTIDYTYTRENSNLEPEVLDEQRVTIGFNYRF
ncbi:MAG: hypothetical protein V1791_14015, partial [Pseudomonadota bacterium]